MSEQKTDPWRRARLRTAAAYGSRYGPFGLGRDADVDDDAFSERCVARAVDDAMFRGRDAGVQALANALAVLPVFVHEAWHEAVAEAAAAGFAVASLDPLQPSPFTVRGVGVGKAWSSTPGLVCTDRILFDPLSQEPHVPIAPDVSVTDGVALPSEHGAHAVYDTYAGLRPVLDAVPRLMRSLLSGLRRYCNDKVARTPGVVHDRTTVFGPLVEFSVTPVAGRLTLGARFFAVYKAAPAEESSESSISR